MTATVEQAMDAELARIFETWSDKDRGEVRRALLAALRAAGWAVVPVAATEAEVKAASAAVCDMFDWTADGRICNSNDQKWAVEAREDVVRVAINASRKVDGA